MFLNTGNHLGLQEDTDYCPNERCWCVNCQFICMQKVHQFPVCFIYEESLQIQNTGPNAFDVSTVSKRCTFGLFPASYMKRVCMQKDMSTCPKAVVVSTVSIFVSMSQGFSRTIPWQTIIKHSMPYLTMANHNKSFHAIPDHEFGAPRCKTYNQSVDGGYDQSKNWKVGALRPFKNWEVGALRPSSFWEVRALRPSSFFADHRYLPLT